MTFPIHQLSVSKLGEFDHTQKGGCGRRSWYNNPGGLRPEQTGAQGKGVRRHSLLEFPLTGRPLPARAEGLTAVKRIVEANAAGQDSTGFKFKWPLLPAPGSDLLIERRFSGQVKYICESCAHSEAEHVDGSCDTCGTACSGYVERYNPLDPKLTPLYFGPYPGDGFIDLMFYRDGVVSVHDHKFTSDVLAFSLAGDDLIKTIQLPSYAVVGMSLFPEAERFALRHNNFSHDGKLIRPREREVTRAQILERKAEIDALAVQLGQTWQHDRAEDVPANPGPACEMWAGCAHQAICSAFKRRGKVELSPEDAAMFGLDDVTPEPIADPVEAVAPKTAPKDDPSLPAPERKPRTKKPKDDTPAAAQAGFVMVHCRVCNAEMGMRPPGSSVHPSLCKNKANHAPESATPAHAHEYELKTGKCACGAVDPDTAVSATSLPAAGTVDVTVSRARGIQITLPKDTALETVDAAIEAMNPAFALSNPPEPLTATDKRWTPALIARALRAVADVLDGK